MVDTLNKRMALAAIGTLGRVAQPPENRVTPEQRKVLQRLYPFTSLVFRVRSRPSKVTRVRPGY